MSHTLHCSYVQETKEPPYFILLKKSVQASTIVLYTASCFFHLQIYEYCITQVLHSYSKDQLFLFCIFKVLNMVDSKFEQVVGFVYRYTNGENPSWVSFLFFPVTLPHMRNMLFGAGFSCFPIIWNQLVFNPVSTARNQGSLYSFIWVNSPGPWNYNYHCLHYKVRL